MHNVVSQYLLWKGLILDDISEPFKKAKGNGAEGQHDKDGNGSTDYFNLLHPESLKDWILNKVYGCKSVKDGNGSTDHLNCLHPSTDVEFKCQLVSCSLVESWLRPKRTVESIHFS